MKRFFYYIESDKPKLIFKHLDKQVDEGFITYRIDENDGIVIIHNLLLEDDDELFKKLIKWDCIEDYEYNDDHIEDDGYDDFYDDDLEY